MVKEWKKIQRADGDFQGTWDGVQKSNVYHTSNKPDKDDVGLGNLDNTKFSGGKFLGEITKADGTSIFDPSTGNFTGTFGSKGISDFYRTDNKPTKSDVGLGNLDNSKFSGGKFLGEITKADGTSVFDPSTGDFTGKIAGSTASDVKSKAEAAKNAVDGTASITMVGGSLSIGTADGGVYPFAVDTSGNLKIKNDEFQALADGTVNCKGNFTINQDSNGDSKIVLVGDSSGTAEVEVQGANPTFDLGGASPLGTSTLHLKRGGTGNQARIQFRTGSSGSEFTIGNSNDTGLDTQYALHVGPLWSSGTDPERSLSFESDGKMGMYANSKSVAGFTFGSDGTNKHVYIKDGGLSIGTTTVSDHNITMANGQQLQWGGTNNAIFGSETSDYVKIKTNGSDRLTVDSDGDVIIGGDIECNAISGDGSNLTGVPAGSLSSGVALSNLGGGTGTTFLRKDGSWATPTNTTYSAGNGMGLGGGYFYIANGGVATAMIADDAVTTAKIDTKAVTGNELDSGAIDHPSKFAADVVDSTAIGSSAVGASELMVSGNGTAGQLLKSDGDGSMTWVTQDKKFKLFETTARIYTRYNYFYYPSTTYGPDYYNWNTTFSSSSLTTSWAAGNHHMIYVPFDCTITTCYLIGEISSTQTIQMYLLKGTPSWNTNSAVSMGSTTIVNTAFTAGQMTRRGSSSLSIDCSKGDIIVPAIRRSTNFSSSSYSYIYGSVYIGGTRD